MAIVNKWGAGIIAGAALIAAGSASAQSQVGLDSRAQIAGAEYVSPMIAQQLSSAQAIRSLNIMLMVTSLRCRTGAHDFRSEYDMFSRTHQRSIEEASDQLTNDLVAAYGEDGSHRELDRMGVSIANSYGDGHPTMGCSDLKEATLELAMSQDRSALTSMAGWLLEGKTPAPVANAPSPTIMPEWVEADPSIARPEVSMRELSSRQNLAKGPASAMTP